MPLRGMTVIVLAAAIGGCPEPDDLPLGWESAFGAAVTQGPCEGSAYDAYTPTVAATGGVGEIVVEFDKVQFRCEQAVEAFVLPDAAGYRVLVQPVDMTPEHVVRCDCLYKVSVRFGAPPGSYQITGFRRSDMAYGGDGRMVKIGSASVLVR
jgi:hypothetical protein